MKVLLISKAFPYPPIDGEVLPTYHILRGLAPKVEFHLAALRPPAEAGFEEGRRVFERWGVRTHVVRRADVEKPVQTWRCLRGGRFWVNRFYSPELAGLVADLLRRENFDVVQGESIFGAQHLPRRTPCPQLLMIRDCISMGHERRCRLERSPRQWVQWRKIQWMESTLLGRCDLALAISPVDRARLRRIRPGVEIEVLPNGVDVEALRPTPEREEPETVLFSGAMSAPANFDAAIYMAREVWPAVRRRVPRARLLLVGRDPTDEVRALAAAASITVTGTVADMGDWLARAAVIVSPLRFGSGLKNKVLEGAAMGKAMVVTPLSLEGIDLAPGREIEVADATEAFADRVAELLLDGDRRERLGRAARRAVEERYTWGAMTERLYQHYEKLASGG